MPIWGQVEKDHRRVKIGVLKLVFFAKLTCAVDELKVHPQLVLTSQSLVALFEKDRRKGGHCYPRWKQNTGNPSLVGLAWK
jgi:hypothetical protein